MRCTSIALLSLVLGGFAETASAQPDNWVWTAREEKQLERLERKAGRQGEFFRLTEGSWFVETAGSARLAAELSLYMDLMQETLVDLLGDELRIGNTPTLRVFAGQAAFTGKSRGSQGAAFYYTTKTEYKPGSQQLRTRIVENHLYAYLPFPDARTINDLDRALLQREAGRAVAVYVVGKQWKSPWFEQGLAMFASSLDLRAARKEMFAARRARSRGMEQIRRMLAQDSEWNPSLEPLLTLTHAGGQDVKGFDGVDPSSVSESLVDLLLTNRKAAKLRATLIKEMARAAAGGSGGLTFERGDLRRLQAPWHAHLKSVLL